MVKISVIMGVYNCESTLGDAIDSILNQTYEDWELIMCEDGSTDNTYAVALKYKEKYPEKIILLKNEKNIGLNATLNKCLKAANGIYIARMDGDDVCSPIRFEEEVKVLDEELEIAIVSSDMNHFDEGGIWGRITHPEYPQRKDFINGTPFCHAACMVRKEAFDNVDGYSVDNKLLRVEDYHLWMKMYKAGYRGKNINKTLYSMRDDRHAYRRRTFKYRMNEAYVRFLIVNELELPKVAYIKALRPIIVGILPGWLYDKLHKWNLRSN